MTRVHLYGPLEQFSPEPITINSSDMREILNNLFNRFGNAFEDIIRENSWHLSKKDKDLDKTMSEEELLFPVEGDLHIFPAITGSGGRGVGQIILGVVLIIIAVVVAVYTGGAAGVWAGLTSGGLATSLALAGVVAIAGGVMAMMTKAPKVDAYGSGSSADPKNSFIYNGAINNTEQGLPIPLVYGIHMTGSTIISGGIDTVLL